MEISNEIKAKMFALYLGHRVELDNGGSKVRNRILCAVGGINDGGHEYVKLKMGTFTHFVLIKENRAKLILKSLSEISDEDMIWVYDENHNLHQQRKLYPEDLAKKTPSLKEMKGMISNGFAHYTGGYLDSSSVHQYLISKGYDVPMMLLGWKTLEQSGLAIYENEK